MENFKALTKMISEIRKLSNQIIRASLPIMRAIEPEQNEYVRNLVEEIPDLTPEQALEMLQGITLEWVKDAEPLAREVDKFLVSDGDSFRINSFEECPVLAEVWNGDAYDKSGIEGLKELREDLKQQLENVNEEYLMKRAKELLLGEEEQ